MCGITGYFNLNECVSRETIQQMADALQHRGPDGGAVYLSENKHYSLGHRRLSFLDLSEQGKQPMKDNSGKIIITFNGEIYNFLELKQELADYPFQNNTDTEVILAGYQKWGVEVVNHLDGMFAFALLDEKKNKLFLVRDRFGIKPLYYTMQDNKLLFASELKAIHASKEASKEIDFSSFADYFVYRYIPSPKTIWKGIQKLAPAHYVEIDLSNLKSQLHEYWKLEGSENRKDSNASQQVGKLLAESVRKHTIADVPIGSFLSGGYDSSALVNYMCEQGQQPDTFSIGFSKWERSEDQFAQIVANHLNVKNEFVVADEKSLELVNRMPDVYDEPIADISIVPTYMVSRLARTKVKAVLSGEGADEIFGGYTWQHDFFKKSYPASWWEKMKNKFQPKNTVDFYAQAMAMGWFDRAELQKMLTPELHSFIPEDVHWFYRQNFNSQLTPLKSIQYMDMKCFMGELVLTKIDRASMANSLEVRVPFLNHSLFEYVFSLGEREYFQPKQTKYLLYENIKNKLPKSILDRKKQGFVGPDAYYMDIEWYRQQFAKSRLIADGIIQKKYIDNLLKETYNWKLWKIVVMEKWYRKWCS